MSNKKDIFEAIDSGSIEDIRYFIKQKKVDINTVKYEDRHIPPLHWAMMQQKYEAAKFLISEGANINMKDGGGATPLHEAASLNNIEIAKLLVSKGANVNLKAMDGTLTPLDMAKSEEMIQYLKSIGAKSAKDTSNIENNNDILLEKKERKIILICSVVGLVLGLITGVIIAVNIGGSDLEGIVIGAIVGMWVGTGLGSALSFLPMFPHLFMSVFKEEGFFAAIKTILIAGIGGFILFWCAGPIGLLVRVLKINSKINGLQKIS